MHEPCDPQIKGPNCAVNIGILVKYAVANIKVQLRFRFQSLMELGPNDAFHKLKVDYYEG
jgi:hypothetical protein